MEAQELKKLLQEQVGKLEKVYPYASAFAAKSGGKYAYYGTYEKHAGITPEKQGVTLTVFNGSFFKEFSTDQISKGQMEELIARIVADQKNDPPLPANSITIDPGTKVSRDYTVECKEPVNGVTLADLLSAGEKYERMVSALDDRIVNAGISYNVTELEEIFVNRHKSLSQRITRVQTVYDLAFQDGQQSSQIWGGDCKNGGAEYLRIAEEDLKKAVEDGLKLLYAKRLTPGTYDCIFSPAMAGMFAHEAFGHGMETDMFLKKRAKGAEYMNRAVASPLVDMYDGPALEGAAGSFFFDHEGEMAATTQIIKKGMLLSGLTDLNSAVRLNLKRTPNGRREAYDHKVYARMTNTYFGTGSATIGEMIASMKNGYLIDYPTNGMEDPKGWGIQLEALMAREIVDGKLTGNCFSPVIVTGYVPELLMSVSMVGSEAEIHGLGYCGKGHKEWVKVTDGGPALKLKARLA